MHSDDEARVLPSQLNWFSSMKDDDQRPSIRTADWRSESFARFA